MTETTDRFALGSAGYAKRNDAAADSKSNTRNANPTYVSKVGTVRLNVSRIYVYHLLRDTMTTQNVKQEALYRSDADLTIVGVAEGDDETSKPSEFQDDATNIGGADNSTERAKNDVGFRSRLLRT